MKIRLAWIIPLFCMSPGMAWAEDQNTSVVRAAFIRLSEAPNHTFELTSSGRAFVKKIVGKTERDGWTVCTQTSTNGTFDFTFKGRKGVINTTVGWETAEDLINPDRVRQPSQKAPMRSEFNLLKSGKLPLSLCIELLDKVGSFLQEGDVYRGVFKPEAIEEMRRGSGDEPGMTSQMYVEVWLKAGFPVKLELAQSLAINGKTEAWKMTVEFGAISTTKVEVPLEARRRLER